MILPDKRIIRLINAHHVLTLATSNNGNPYCANCFYTYLENKNLFVLTSENHTRHIKNILLNNQVAGTIFLETKIIGKIKGIQFTGNIQSPYGEMLREAKNSYLLKFPVAMIMNTIFWIIEPDFIKMTDNLFGIGNKMIWEKGKESVMKNTKK